MTNDSFSAVHITGICLLIIGVGLLTPILCYSLYQFYCISVISADLIKFRNKSLVYCMNTLAILSFCTERIFIILYQILHIGESAVPVWLPFIAERSFGFAFYTLFLIKTWLSYYSREYHRRLVELTWTQHINPDTSKLKNDWIIKHKNRLGSPHFLMKIGFAVFILQISIEIMVDTVIGKELIIDHIIHLFSTLFVFIVSFVLYFKTRDFNDIYHIKKEIQYQTLILLFILLIDICAVSYGMIFVNPIEWIISLLLGNITWFSISLISTAYPVYLYKRNIDTLRIKKSESVDKESRHYLTEMLRLISHKDGFKSFMVHLIKEYSTENLLFLLELVEIKSEFQMNHNNVLKVPQSIDLSDVKIASSDRMTVNFNVDDGDTSDGGDLESQMTQRSNSSKSQSRRISLVDIMTYLMHANGGSVFCKIVLPYSLPQSAILEGASNDLCQQMMYLYNKYIKLDSQHEINVSFDQRNGLKNLFEGNLKDHIESEYDIFNVMDEAAIQILNLLFNSFQRFKMSATYKEMKEKIKYNKYNRVKPDFNEDKLSSLYLTNTSSSISIN